MCIRDRYRELHGVTVRTDTPEHFMDDLKKYLLDDNVEEKQQEEPAKQDKMCIRDSFYIIPTPARKNV